MENKHAAIKIWLLGTPKVETADQPISITNRRAIALMAYLSLEQERHSQDKLASLLWPEYKDTRAHANLRRTLWVLSQTPLGPFLSTEQDGVRLNQDDGLWVDAVDMSQGISIWREKESDESTPEEIEAITSSIEMYRGDFLQDLELASSEEFEAWAAIQRNGLRSDVLDGLDFLVDYALSREDYETAKETAWKALEIDNLNESAFKGLMIALSRSGEPAAAMAQYDILSELLGEEGSEPSTEIAALYERIRSEAQTKLMPQPVYGTEPERTSPGDVSMPVFLFTDIENSTRLWDEHREVMLGALQRHNTILEELIGRYGGRIIELRGDGVYAVFEGGEPLEAVVRIQIAFGQTDWGAIGALRIRVGLHGVQIDWEGYDYFRDGDAYFGPVLNHAARVMDAAWGGQILLSEIVHNSFTLPEEATYHDFGVHALKGCEEPLRIFGLLHPELQQKSFPPIRSLTTQDSENQVEVAPTSALALPESPYRGLYAFREEERLVFLRS